MYNYTYNRRDVNSQTHSKLSSSTTRICTEFKEISVDTNKGYRVLRGDTRFINDEPVSTREENVKSSEAVSGTSSENTSVDFRFNITNRLVVFNCSSCTSSTNKFQVPTTTTNTSIKNTRIILQKSDSKQKFHEEELQWWIKKLEIYNVCYLIQPHIQVLKQTDLSRKEWGGVCQGISTGGGVMVK